MRTEDLEVIIIRVKVCFSIFLYCKRTLLLALLYFVCVSANQYILFRSRSRNLKKEFQAVIYSFLPKFGKKTTINTILQQKKFITPEAPPPLDTSLGINQFQLNCVKFSLASFYQNYRF